MPVNPREERPSGAGSRRDSIWSVKESARSAYYAIFSVAFLSGLAIAIQRQFGGGAPVHDRIGDAVEFLGAFTVAAAAATVVAVELGGQVMVLAETTREWIRRRQERAMAKAVAKAREEGRAEGRAEARAEILRLVRDSHPDLVIPDFPGTNGQEDVP